MTKTKSIVELKPVRPAMDDGLVSLIEFLRTRALNGELLSLVIVGEMRAGAPLIGHSLPDGYDYYRLQGALAEVSVMLRTHHDSVTDDKRTEY